MGRQSARLVGGAGTGKTTELLAIMGKVLQVVKDPSKIGFASFTRAARSEMVARASEAFGCHPSMLDRHGWFRTAHSTCIKQLEIGSERILSGDNEASKWVADRLRVRVSWKKVGDSAYTAAVGDEEAAAAISMWDVSRNRIEPLAAYHAARSRAGADVPSLAVVKHWVKQYEDAKKRDGRIDYSDVLARFCGIEFTTDGPEATAPQGVPPMDVEAWVFDEAQDSSKLVDRVFHRLADGYSVKWVYLAADPFQSVFSFGGADYRNFLSWQVDKERTMPQSYRCPPPVMELGEKCLRRMKTGYFDRGIAPASHEGEVQRAASMEHALREIDGSRSTLVLARCGYSLDKFEEILKSRRIPHARISKSDDTKALTAFNALWKLQHGKGVSHDEWKAAVELLPTSGSCGEGFEKRPMLVRGAKTAWRSGRHEGEIDFVAANEIESIGGGTPELVEAIRQGRWASLLDGGGAWFEVAKRHGPAAATSPNVRLSTIHGAKGMEAQDVVLATETAGIIERAREADPAAYDEECRIEYVGVTRARERLIICESDEPYAMELPR